MNTDRSETILCADASGQIQPSLPTVGWGCNQRAYIEIAMNGSTPFTGITLAAARVPIPLTAISSAVTHRVGTVCLNHSTSTRSQLDHQWPPVVVPLLPWRPRFLRSDCYTILGSVQPIPSSDVDLLQKRHIGVHCQQLFERSMGLANIPIDALDHALVLAAIMPTMFRHNHFPAAPASTALV